MKNYIPILSVAALLSGCAASTKSVGSVVLPTSNKTIDVVQHRSDSNECAVGFVLQTYNASGELIDSKSGYGNALHCQVIGAGIQAGGMIGAASMIRPSSTKINNSNSQAQGQSQSQQSTNTNTAQGGEGGKGGKGGNNGFGNGGGDGSPNGHEDGDR